MSGRAGLFAVRSGQPLPTERLFETVTWRGDVSARVNAGLGWTVLTTGTAAMVTRNEVTVALHGWVAGFEGATIRSAEYLAELVNLDGLGALKRLEGGFAAIIVDASRGLAVASRDFMGTRPLCWGAENDNRAISSEPLGIPLLLGQTPKPDESTIDHYLAKTRPGVTSTFVAGAFAVPPDAILKFKADQVVVEARLRRIEQIDIADADAIARIRSMLDASVAARLSGSTSPASQASGGVDSGVVASAATNINHTTSLITHRVRGLAEWDETRRAAELAKLCDAKHTIVEMEPAEIFESVISSILIHGPSHPTMWLSGRTTVEAAVLGHDVLLTGQFGDEWLTMAGGPLAHAVWSRRLRPTLAFAQSGISADNVSRADMARMVARLSVSGLVRGRRHGQHVLDTFKADAWVQRANTGIERVGSLNDIRIEHPFADWDFVRLVLGLDVWQRNRPEQPKRILRQAYADLLPQSYVDDPIKANFFGIPEFAFGGEFKGSEAWAEIRRRWVIAWRESLAGL